MSENNGWVGADEWLAHLRRTGFEVSVPDGPLNFSDAAIIAENIGVPYRHHSDGTTMVSLSNRHPLIRKRHTMGRKGRAGARARDEITVPQVDTAKVADAKGRKA